MNVRILSVLGVLVMMVVAWFFYQEDTKFASVAPIKPNMAYEVNEIRAVQTNEKTGDVEYTLTADSLVQNAAGEDEMLDAVLNWQVPQGEKYVITTKRITLDQDTGNLKISDGFVMMRMATDTKPALVFEGRTLFGNVKSRQLTSNESLLVKNGKDEFYAAKMTADLNLGEYEFSKIKMQYHAIERKDKLLF